MYSYAAFRIHAIGGVDSMVQWKVTDHNSSCYHWLSFFYLVSSCYGNTHPSWHYYDLLFLKQLSFDLLLFSCPSHEGENPTNDEPGFSLITRHDYFIHKYTFMDAIYHDEARFSPHERTKTAKKKEIPVQHTGTYCTVNNVDDHLFWKSW
jgi:hypothetical protein